MYTIEICEHIFYVHIFRLNIFSPNTENKIVVILGRYIGGSELYLKKNYIFNANTAAQCRKFLHTTNILSKIVQRRRKSRNESTVGTIANRDQIFPTEAYFSSFFIVSKNTS